MQCKLLVTDVSRRLTGPLLYGHTAKEQRD